MRGRLDKMKAGADRVAYLENFIAERVKAEQEQRKQTQGHIVELEEAMVALKKDLYKTKEEVNLKNEGLT